MRSVARLIIIAVLALAVHASGAGASARVPHPVAAAQSTRYTSGQPRSHLHHAHHAHARSQLHTTAGATRVPAAPAPARPAPRRHATTPAGTRIHHRTPRDGARYAVLPSVALPRAAAGPGMLLTDLHLSNHDPSQLREAGRGPPRASPHATFALRSFACARVPSARASGPVPDPGSIPLPHMHSAPPAFRRARRSVVRSASPRPRGHRRAAASRVWPGRTLAVRRGGAAANPLEPPFGGSR